MAVHPNWTDDISKLFSAPYWLGGQDPGWIDMMNTYTGTDMSDYDTMKAKALEMYRHLQTRSMPLNQDATEFWPDAALEQLRTWMNNGCPQASDSTVVTVSDQAYVPPQPRAPLRVRKDLRSLTQDELNLYRSKLDDVLNPGEMLSGWQELGNLHGEWCLHYQEASFLWHRAFLLYVEELIGFPIPYWDFFALSVGDSTSPDAGIPQAFLEDSYQHPTKGPRPNPLKWALSLNGKSADGTSRFVVRDKILVNGPQDVGWPSKIAYFQTLYFGQFQAALQQSTFSQPQDWIPWAAILKLTEQMPDDQYPHRSDFDGLFEQAHDNIHGWVGPDMADNSYTAFDPIFYSFHSNCDRLVAEWIETHPQSQYTSNFPLIPFTSQGTALDYNTPAPGNFTTIGDMARPTILLNYAFAAPASPDAFVLPAYQKPQPFRVKPKGGKTIHLLKSLHAQPVDTSLTESPGLKTSIPHVVFTNVACTTRSYQLDIFLSTAQSLVPDPLNNPDYIGRIVRLGMGPSGGGGALPGFSKAASRCEKPSVTRSLRADHVLGRVTEGAKMEITQVVTELGTGKVISETEWRTWAGFQPAVLDLVQI